MGCRRIRMLAKKQAPMVTRNLFIVISLSLVSFELRGVDHFGYNAATGRHIDSRSTPCRMLLTLQNDVDPIFDRNLLTLPGRQCPINVSKRGIAQMGHAGIVQMYDYCRLPVEITHCLIPIVAHFPAYRWMSHRSRCGATMCGNT